MHRSHPFNEHVDVVHPRVVGSQVASPDQDHAVPRVSNDPLAGTAVLNGIPVEVAPA